MSQTSERIQRLAGWIDADGLAEPELGLLGIQEALDFCRAFAKVAFGVVPKNFSNDPTLLLPKQKMTYAGLVTLVGEVVKRDKLVAPTTKLNP